MRAFSSDAARKSSSFRASARWPSFHNSLRQRSLNDAQLGLSLFICGLGIGQRLAQRERLFERFFGLLFAVETRCDHSKGEIAGRPDPARAEPGRCRQAGERPWPEPCRHRRVWHGALSIEATTSANSGCERASARSGACFRRSWSLKPAATAWRRESIAPSGTWRSPPYPRGSARDSGWFCGPGSSAERNPTALPQM